MSKDEYIESLKLAKASENDAIKRYNVAISLSNSEKDKLKLSEILNDENEHDAIVTDLLVKAVSGQDGKNTTYFATDSMQDVMDESNIIQDIRLMTKQFRTALNNYNMDEARESITKINELFELLGGPDEDDDDVFDGSSTSGNYNHAGRPGHVGGSSTGKGKLRAKKKRKDD